MTRCCYGQPKRKALGFPVSQGGVDGFAGFATNINQNSLVGVALHELTHALGRAPSGLPLSSGDIPDIFDLFRFDSASGMRLVDGDFGNAPPAYFSVNNGGTILANYGQTSDPGDFFSTTPIDDPFDEFYIPGATFQSLTQFDLTQLDVLGFNTSTATFSWTNPEDGEFAVGSNWTSGGTSPATTSPTFNDNVLITVSGASSYTVSSLADETINSLVMAAGATLDITSGIFTIDNGTNFYTTSGVIEVSSGGTLALIGKFMNAGTIDAAGGTIELSGTISSIGANVVTSGGTLFVAVGGSAASVTVSSGGTEIVGGGGADAGAQISGGEQNVFGFASGAVVFAGTQVIESGGTATSTTVKSGGMIVLSGAATLNQAKISAGGVLAVGAGAILSSFAVSSGVLVEVTPGGVRRTPHSPPAARSPFSLAAWPAQRSFAAAGPK
jgi:serralysin